MRNPRDRRFHPLLFCPCCSAGRTHRFVQGSCNIISYHVDMGDPKVTGRQFSFVLSNTGMRTYVFAVKNQLQLDTWMGVLKQAVDVTQDIEPPENPLKRAASRATMLKRRTYITASMRISEEKGLSLEDMATEVNVDVVEWVGGEGEGLAGKLLIVERCVITLCLERSLALRLTHSHSRRLTHSPPHAHTRPVPSLAGKLRAARRSAD